MELFIIRHGIALDVGQEGITRDADRPLSGTGRRKTVEVAHGLAAIGVKLERIGTSPLIRAEETAQILAAEIDPGIPVEICEFLEPGAVARDVVAWVRRGGWRNAAIVGHMPDLSMIAADLLGAPAATLTFKKAGVACLSFAGPLELSCGELKWLIQPGQMLALLHHRSLEG